MNHQYEEELRKVACEVWDHPEPGFAEFVSSKVEVDYLKSQGFEVEENVVDTVTGYVAKYGHGRPVIAILGEFDALYGLGQEACTPVYSPDGKEMGHGCGHHLLGTGAIGAGMLVRDYLKEKNCEGTVLVCGCPAEEAGSGKVYMARDGVFDDVDIALTWHPASINQVDTGSSQSNITAFFRFHGKAAHAAGAPETGRSALDAVELMDIGVNYLREHMPTTDRVHYAITNSGGKSPNVVQPEAEVNYFCRSMNNPGAVDLYRRVCAIAKGAAMMTETTVDIAFDSGVSNTVPNFVLEDLLAECFREVGTAKLTEEDLKTAAEFAKAALPFRDAEIRAYCKDKKKYKEDRMSSPICTYFVENEHSDMPLPGTTDVSDVSWVIPTAQINTATWVYGTPGHSWQIVAQGKTDYAMKAMYNAAEILARAAIRLIEDPELVKKAKAEHFERTGGKPYESLVPKNIKPHVAGDI